MLPLFFFFCCFIKTTGPFVPNRFVLAGKIEASWLWVSGAAKSKLLTVKTNWRSPRGRRQPRVWKLINHNRAGIMLSDGTSKCLSRMNEVNRLGRQKNGAFLLPRTWQHMDLTAVKRAGGERERERERGENDRKRLSCPDSVVSCLKVTAWASVADCCKEPQSCEKPADCRGNVNAGPRAWWRKCDPHTC